MLTMVSDTGRATKQVYPMKETPYLDKFEAWKDKLGTHYSDVRDYVAERIESQDSFSAATLFPQLKWANTPLMHIHSTLNDMDLSAWFLGLLIMNIIINDLDQWLVTKTQFTQREFMTCFYWRKYRR